MLFRSQTDLAMESYIVASGDETEADSQHRLYQCRPIGMPQPASLLLLMQSLLWARAGVNVGHRGATFEY